MKFILGFTLLYLNLGLGQAQLFTCATNPTNSFCIAPSATCLASSEPQRVNNDPIRLPVDSTLQDYIVSQHNVRRGRVALGSEFNGNPGPQPASRCMGKLVWDAELATSAQNWADQCPLAADTNRNINRATDSYVGQNIYAYVDPIDVRFITPNYRTEQSYWDEAINSWYNEVALMPNTGVASYTYAANVGHYTQMVWGRTTHIGCGWRRSPYFNKPNQFVRVLVCNYWPGGNLAGTPVYPISVVGSTPCTIATCNNNGFIATGAAKTTDFVNRAINGPLCV